MDRLKPILEMLLKKGHSVEVQDHPYNWKWTLRAGNISVEAIIASRRDALQTRLDDCYHDDSERHSGWNGF
jgi:hypothetical protein